MTLRDQRVDHYRRALQSACQRKGFVGAAHRLRRVVRVGCNLGQFVESPGSED